MRVLVIEDDRKVASFIQTGLAQEGYSVDVLNDGGDAGGQAHAIDYDAVVLDLMLPGRSGFQVLRDIRARKASLPVLILTAKDSLEERVAGIRPPRVPDAQHRSSGDQDPDHRARLGYPFRQHQ